jgi:hypothetical protein
LLCAGALATITDIDTRMGALKVRIDAGDHRLLDAAYAAEHLEHVYALTGHGAEAQPSNGPA